MADRIKVSVTVEEDILDRLRELHKQATVERSHYYVGKCVKDAIAEIERLRGPFRGADDKDWKRLFEMLPDSGHGRFWQAVMNQVRAALAGTI